MAVPNTVIDLVDRYHRHGDDYASASYNETQVRREFIDPLFEALGWDINNRRGYAEAYKDVIHEDALKIGGTTKAPDYAFRIGGTRKFFLEAKKPSISIKEGIGPAYQLRRYAWSAKLSLSVLTDFEEFAVYDCRIKPEQGDRASVARVNYYTFEEYAEKWDEIGSVFSRKAVLRGSFDKYAEDKKRKRGTTEVDSAFLEEIESWRAVLAWNIALHNPTLFIRELNTAVQRTIDRIIFLRIAEDRGIEPYGQLQKFAREKGVYQGLTQLFRGADERYNSGLFHFRKGDGSDETLDTFTLDLTIDDRVLTPILSSLYYPESPYEFSVLPADILGQVYERFLGKIIRFSGKRAVIEEKPEVKKAGGVYYTPTYIVQYIVGNTLGPILKDRTPAQVSGSDKRMKDSAPLRVLDPACGSGSFLLEAYRYLLAWHQAWYIEDGPEKHIKGKEPKLLETATGDWRLTLAERRRILLTHIYGVDIDPQAVEVTKLSLLLKVLEGEDMAAMARQMEFFRVRALPDLGDNIRCGNSLISSEFFSEQRLRLFSDDEQFRINVFDWQDEFPFLNDTEGFAVIIGNPPWISLTGKFRNEIYSKEERDYLVRRHQGNSYMPNMYEYFISKGLELLAPGGYFSFIVPDRFGYNDQFIDLRKKVLTAFRLQEVLYGAPFPNVVADTAIFNVMAQPVSENDMVRIGEFGEEGSAVPVTKLLDDTRVRFENVGDEKSAELVEKICHSIGIRPLKEIIRTTSGVGAKSSCISKTRLSDQQREILKGESIHRYGIGEHLYFEFKKENITGRTTDETKLGYIPKLLVRKTGKCVIAAYDDSGRYPEQSLYFTFGNSAVPIFYLLGLLNSKLMQFVFFTKALTNRRSIAQVKKEDLDVLPIQTGSNGNIAYVEKIAGLAEQVTELGRRFFQEKTVHGRKTTGRLIRATEREIDETVFEAYGLSTQEREFIESAVLKQMQN